MNPNFYQRRWHNSTDSRLAAALARAEWLNSIRRRKEKRK